jgi:hypothetical protein
MTFMVIQSTRLYFFVGAPFVERQTALKGCMGLWEHIYLGRIQNVPDKFASQPSYVVAETCDSREEFRENLFRRDQSRIFQLHCFSGVSPRVVGKKYSDPVERIHEDGPQRFVDP